MGRLSLFESARRPLHQRLQQAGSLLDEEERWFGGREVVPVREEARRGIAVLLPEGSSRSQRSLQPRDHGWRKHAVEHYWSTTEASRARRRRQWRRENGDRKPVAHTQRPQKPICFRAAPLPRAEQREVVLCSGAGRNPSRSLLELGARRAGVEASSRTGAGGDDATQACFFRLCHLSDQGDGGSSEVAASKRLPARRAARSPGRKKNIYGLYTGLARTENCGVHQKTPPPCRDALPAPVPLCP